MNNLQVNIKDQKNRISFSDVTAGNLFLSKGRIWLKYGQGRVQHPHSNAISLKDGLAGLFDENQEVNDILSAVLTVEVE